MAKKSFVVLRDSGRFSVISDPTMACDDTPVKRDGDLGERGGEPITVQPEESMVVDSSLDLGEDLPKDIPKISCTSISAEPLIVITNPQAVDVLNSSLYKSPIFSVTVGPLKDLFSVHQAILSASPILKEKCTLRVNVYSSTCLELLDVNPESFALLLDFLYTGDFNPTPGWSSKDILDMRTLGLEDESSIKCCKEGRLYCLALDYQLHQLQDLITQKMQIHGHIPFHNFLKIAEETYEKFEDGQGVSFREQFKSQATREFKDNRDAVWQNWIAAAVRRGGHLAADLFASLASNNVHTPPTEVREGIPKLEIAESAIDPPSIEVDSGDSQKDLSVSNSRKTRKKKDKKDIKTFAMPEEDPYRPPSPYPEALASCDEAKEETKHDCCCRNCGYG